MADFDPKAHISKLPIKNRQGEKIGERDYMTVESRLRWINAERPVFSIVAEIVELTADWAVVRATVEILDEAGAVTKRAVAHRTCTAKRWGDYLEKAETGAVGRALVLLGYGTGSAGDFDDLADAEPPAPGPAPRPKRGSGWRSRDEAEERAEAEQAKARQARQGAGEPAEASKPAEDTPAAVEADTRPLAERLADVDLPAADGPEPTPAQFVEWVKAHGIPGGFALGVLGIRTKNPEIEIEHVESFVAANPRRPLRAELRAIAERWNKRNAIERERRAKAPAAAR